MRILKTTRLTKRYDGKPAVDDAGVTLEAGRIYGLLGPNGSGKSTFMKMAAGLVRPTSGGVEVMGAPPGPAARAHIAYMPTEPYFYEYMTVAEVARFHADFYRDFSAADFGGLIRRMGLDPGMKVSQLSSGMAAKLKIAVAASRNARLIMLDEPLNGIDLIARDAVVQAIIGRAREDCALLISSHLIDELETILDEVIFMREGRIALQGGVEEIRERRGKSIADLYREVYAS